MISVSGSHPIRFFGSGRSGNEMEGPYFITVEQLLFSFLRIDPWLVEKVYHFEELF